MADVSTESRKPRFPIVIRVDEELRDAMKTVAQAEDRTMASLIRTALRTYVTAAR